MVQRWSPKNIGTCLLKVNYFAHIDGYLDVLPLVCTFIICQVDCHEFLGMDGNMEF